VDLAALMDQVFKFQIGEAVWPRSMVDGNNLAADLGMSRNAYDRVEVHYPDIIGERFLQQCHGGVQKFYRIRRTTNAGELLLNITEFELVSSAEYKAALLRIQPKPRDEEPRMLDTAESLERAKKRVEILEKRLRFENSEDGAK
jgi:hypothetical protein